MHQFGARQGAHDDLVLAVALAVFGLSRSRMARGRFDIGWAM
jgi:hypothetical protein